MPSTVQGNTGGRGTAAIATRYPATEGLTAGTEKQEGTQANLVPEDSSKVNKKDLVGIR